MTDEKTFSGESSFGDPFAAPQKESIKLTKNAKGDYQWEIKINPVIETHLVDDDVERLEKINEQLNKKFGGNIK